MAKNIRILILEDIEDDVLLLLRALKKGGYDPEYEVVDNSGDFINAINSREWDLIISDYSMPGYNGIQALRTYQAMDIDIPFILVSGTIGEEVAVEAMREGAHDYLMKSSLQRLVPAIERELREARIRRQSREDSMALKKSEEKFAKAFRTSTDAITIAKACSGEFMDINDGFTRIFGHSREDVLGKTSLELGIWRTDEERNAFVTPLIENGVVRDREVQFRTRSGTVVTALISGELLDIEGERCILTFTKDITERRKAAKALEESESRLRNIIENANQIIFTIDGTGRVTFISPAWRRIMGYEEKDILGKVFLDFVHPEDLEMSTSALASVVNKKHLAEPVVIRLKHRAGDWRWLRVAGSYLENLDPDVPQYGGIAEDITEAKISADKLRESNLRLNTLLEAIPDMVYLKDTNGTLLEVNRAYEEITGLSRDRILGTGGEDFLPEKILKINRDTDREVISSGTMVQFNDLYRSSEHEIYVSVRKVPLKDEEGTVTGIVGVTSDITDILKAEQKYRSALEGAIQTMSRIVELRDPYTAGHQNRASRLAVEIGRKMGFNEERLEGVRVASLLYEIGKINVPSEILNKPGKITSMEYELIQGHPQSAWDILKNIDFPWPVAEIVHQHHERMDGSGYPSGLKGEDILLEARIIAVADVVEAMCSHRPYRPSLGIDKALEEIERGSGILYDSQVAALCIELFRKKGFVME